MKKLLAVFASLLLLTGCGTQPGEIVTAPEMPPAPSEGVSIRLSDDAITVEGDTENAVTTANDIVYYPTGKDFTFGEGTEADAHEAAQADAHTVVHISKPGTYTVTGTIRQGQIAVDLGEEAQSDPEAVVTLVLDNADITCTVAPAIIFYNVYECGDKDAPAETVDTAAAGANVVLAEGSVNRVNGAYVARIYKEGTVELSEDGTEVVDAKKLHKYDATLYSKMSMNVDGTGELYIDAENEGLDSELHLTINGGEIHIRSGNDGINTNEDGVSVTTVNGGLVDIVVTGETGEGDGIDSNGWLVINGGEVRAAACNNSADAGIDSDMGIDLNGGTVIASGHMLDRIAGGSDTYCVFTFTQTQEGGQTYTLKNADGETVLTAVPENGFSILILAAADLPKGEYSLYCGEDCLMVAPGGMGGGMRPMGDRMPPEGMEFPEGERPEPPEGMEFPEGERPEPPEGMELPEGERPELPEGMTPPEGGFGGRGFKGEAFEISEASERFTVKTGENMFTVVMD